MPELLILQFARIVGQVIFPIYTKIRNVPGSLAVGFGKATTYVSLVPVPLGVGLALLARPFTLVFLSEKWADAIPVIQAIALYALSLSLMHNINSAYKAQGNFKVITSLGLIRLLFLAPALWWAAAIASSIVAIGWMHALVAFVSLLINLVDASHMLKISLFGLLKSIGPSFMAGGAMAVMIRVVLHLSGALSSVEQLLVAIPVGAISYGVVLWLASRETMLEVFQKLHSALARRRANLA